jgi:hypothetical protein
VALKSSRVVSSSSCPVTTNAPVTITCPAPTAVFPTAVLPTAVFPTAISPTELPVTVTDVNALLAQLGLSPTTGAVCPTTGEVSLTAVSPATSTPGEICISPLAQLGAVNPFAALAASNPAAALAALSPVLGMFNPACNPACAPTQAPASLPFGKFFKNPWCKPFGI